VIDYLQSRTVDSIKGIIGKPTTQFEYNRAKLIDDLGDSASKVFLTFDRKKQAEKITDSIKAGILHTAIAEIGAVGLGSLLYASIFDVTGLFSAGVVAVSGLAILPYRRARLISNLNSNIEELRSKMNLTLQVHFKQQLEDGILKMKDNFSSYTHFVNKEYADIGTASEKLNQDDSEMKILQKDIDKAFNRTST